MNKLYYGDCLPIMEEMSSNCVDLIYLDPPFNSNRQYNSIYKDETGRPLPEQVEAFCDQWTLDEERERAIRNMPILMRNAGLGDDIAEFWKTWVTALRKTQPGLLAYLSYMVQRLLIMRRLLSPKGAIYLHCDPTASHYIKIMMDGIFGHKNFRREIIWNLQTASGYKSQVKGYVRGHDTILYYVANQRHFTFHKQFREHKPEYIARFKKKDSDGRLYRDDRPGGRRQYLDTTPGTALTDVWSDIMSFQQNSTAAEYLGYQTQKPLALLKRIIEASSDKEDVVLDPFCGCATTIEAAHELGRKWIGIDIAIHAIKRVAKKRLEERLNLVEGKDFVIEGIPKNLEGAKDLWERDKYQFQKWCIESVDGFVTTKRTSDGGIDGRIYFDIHGESELQSMVVEVKGGKNVTIADLRALHSVMERDNAQMAGLIIMEPLSERKLRNFRGLMAQAGDLTTWKPYPRMQILTVQEILDGFGFNTPLHQGRRRQRQPDLITEPSSP